MYWQVYTYKLPVHVTAKTKTNTWTIDNIDERNKNCEN